MKLKRIKFQLLFLLAEPFKMWLVKLGRQEVDNVFDPSKGIDKMIDYYLSKGYSLEWIETRIKAIIDRKKLVNIWRGNGITDLGEIATRELARKYKPDGFDENRKIAKEGGEVAKIARDDLEKKLGESVISSDNLLMYQYIDNNLIDTK